MSRDKHPTVRNAKGDQVPAPEARKPSPGHNRVGYIIADPDMFVVKSGRVAQKDLERLKVPPDHILIQADPVDMKGPYKIRLLTPEGDTEVTTIPRVAHPPGRKRAMEYPETGDQLEAIYALLDVLVDEVGLPPGRVPKVYRGVRKAIQDVKDKYPTVAASGPGGGRGGDTP